MTRLCTRSGARLETNDSPPKVETRSAEENDMVEIKFVGAGKFVAASAPGINRQLTFICRKEINDSSKRSIILRLSIRLEGCRRKAVDDPKMVMRSSDGETHSPYGHTRIPSAEYRCTRLSL